MTVNIMASLKSCNEINASFHTCVKIKINSIKFGLKIILQQQILFMPPNKFKKKYKQIDGTFRASLQLA
jgi:hypothetical protein